MKFYHGAAFAVVLALMAVGCHEAPVGDSFADDNYNPKGALVIPSNVQTGFFDLADPDNAGIAFDLDLEGSASVSAADVQAILYDGVTGEATASGLVTQVTAFPQTLEVSLDDVLTGLGVEMDDVAVGDEVVFAFDAITSGAKYRSNKTVSAPFSCASNLAGTYDYVTVKPWCDPSLTNSGESVWTEIGAGRYDIDDFAFGSYEVCYGPGSSLPEGTLAVVDVCNKISIAGVSQWQEVYTWDIIDVSGADMTVKWSNDYGEAGETTLTRKDGSNWPPLSTN